jgi:putative transcriptional regulator
MQNRFQISPSNNLLGTLLVAAPSLLGNSFEKTVVLILQHNSSGTFGVVLNRPANEEMLSEWEAMTGQDPVNRCFVQGGPIGGPVFAIHQQQAIGEVAMPCGLYVSADSELLQKLMEQDDDRYRIVFGVASWSIGQLESEISSGIWYPLDARADDIFDDANWMWEKSLRRYGEQATRDVLGIERLPENPNWN